jgi:hypothetical protein
VDINWAFRLILVYMYACMHVCVCIIYVYMNINHIYVYIIQIVFENICIKYRQRGHQGGISSDVWRGCVRELLWRRV